MQCWNCIDTLEFWALGAGLSTDNEGPVELSSEAIQIFGAMSDMLPDDSQRAVLLHFGLHDGQPKDFDEVGEFLGVSSKAASDLIAKAIEILRVGFAERATHRSAL